MWSTDFELAKARTADGGQVLAEIRRGYYQVITWADGGWRENTNHLRIRDEGKMLRWRPINDETKNQ